MSSKSYKADLTLEERKEFPELFEKVKIEFKEGLETVQKLWKNNDILGVILQKDIEFPSSIYLLSTLSDEMIVNVLYSVYEYYDCVDCLTSTNNPFVNKVTKLFHKSRSNLIRKTEQTSN